MNATSGYSPKRRRTANRYLKAVHRDRERLAAEERKARGERNETEQAVDDILQRILPPDHGARR